MAVIQFHKVAVLPGVLQSNAFYFVENGSYCESYVTDSAGVARSIGNSAMINALIEDALANWSGEASALDIVADIAARDALTATLDRNAMILVIDATGDPTVSSGSALYAYAANTDTTYKLAEYESMDVVVQWSSIDGRPASSPAQIDTAVSQAHTHANKATLDKFSEAGGLVRFSGAPIPADWDTANW
ncbi:MULTISPECIES: hypothetical protein [unclassified Pseudomonas]|uniref:hypothetical protein n=1 Tax=unclassified Pseudomonas TaxID=196821 RepID=UPI0024479552|nr:MULTISPECIES: hypothetical protein [unclassified Pseudomonas]MDG9928394.1 hypothetical protein [Pseudomonas sp. GD04042]MDH0482564.1 hypothetical protein [Pseudomonas sp. GD04015]MDH0604734.1 hypothetical protein [Pseudomonas sp. GD03869]